MALDLHYGRLVRHLEKLADPPRLTEHPAMPLAEARHRSLASAYPLVRDEVVRRLGPLANGRQRELRERLVRQEARMRRYYADLRAELDAQARRGKGGDEAEARAAARRNAIGHEERLRVAELQQKSTLCAELRLLTLLLVQQPKLLLRCTAGRPGRDARPHRACLGPPCRNLGGDALPPVPTANLRPRLNPPRPRGMRRLLAIVNQRPHARAARSALGAGCHAFAAEILASAPDRVCRESMRNRAAVSEVS